MSTNKGFDDVVWTIPDKTKGNCYVFALAPNIGRGGYYRNRLYKARPGDKCTRFKRHSFDFQHCEDIVKRVLCDNPKYVTKVPQRVVNSKMDNQHHLMAAVLSPGNNKDFHFLRRIPIEYIYKSWDKLKHKTPRQCVEQLVTIQPKYVWAHQRGWSAGGPIIHDAQGNLIINPKTANFDYKRLNYSIYCGLFKVKTRHATVVDDYDI